MTQVMPSVSIASGTRRSIRPKAVINVGEIATPLTNTAVARSAVDVPAKGSGSAVRARTLTAISNWRCNGMRIDNAPSVIPTRNEPMA